MLIGPYKQIIIPAQYNIGLHEFVCSLGLDVSMYNMYVLYIKIC
jgi:hypothetical protein